jgi:hypothetical protein
LLGPKPFRQKGIAEYYMARRDGKLVKKLDPMHIIVPLLYPGRCDNEAFISERIDLTNINAYLTKLNQELEKSSGELSDDGGNDGNPVFKYTLFHLIVTAIMKTLRLRPKMNYFIANKRIYERNDITSAFVVKKAFSDNGAEALAVIKAEDEDNLFSVHEKIREQVYSCRSDVLDSSSESMDIISKLPFFLTRFIVWSARKLDVHGKVPKTLIESDPYYCSVVLSNLGSIKLRSGYHHLTNWGTNSVFVIIGEKKLRPVFKEDGTYEMKETVDLGVTIDERLADGYYYSKSIRLFKKLLENPELLELPMQEVIDY